MRYGMVVLIAILALALPGCATKQKKAFDKFTDKVADKIEEDCPDVDLAAGWLASTATGLAGLFGSEEDAADTGRISVAVHRASVAGCDFIRELVAEE